MKLSRRKSSCPVHSADLFAFGLSVHFIACYSVLYNDPKFAAVPVEPVRAHEWFWKCSADAPGRRYNISQCDYFNYPTTASLKEHFLSSRQDGATLLLNGFFFLILSL